MGHWDGKKIRILSDHWIPGTPPYFLQPTSPIPATATINYLMDDEMGTWNEENIACFFLN